MTSTDDDRFERVTLPFADGEAAGWRCVVCGWECVADDEPPAHECPTDGQWQRVWLEALGG